VYLRRCYRARDGKRHAYWALVKSARTARGPRQQVVAYLGEMDAAGRLGMKEAAQGSDEQTQGKLFEASEQSERRWVEVDQQRVRVEKGRAFGGYWLGMQLADRLGLNGELERLIEPGREKVRWPMMALVLVLCRLCEPSSELHIAEHAFEHSALGELLGIPSSVVNDARLYRALDQLLPCKDALQKHLKSRLGELFDLKYDLLLYDVTSTYFEGQCQANPLAARGYSRDSRGDCKQVCIALVVSRCGMPIGYELFAGNKADVSSVEQIVTTMEDRYGKSDRIWVMDRGMSSADNIEFLKQDNRRYIIGTPKSMLKKYERELLSNDWSKVRDGLEVKLCADPEADLSQPPETFILCRSADRAAKERAMHERFEKRIEEGLTRIVNACHRQKLDAIKVSHRVGKLLGQNTRAAGAFKTTITADPTGCTRLKWEKVPGWRSWAMLSEGCYLLRSNVSDWTAEELWQAYMQLTEAESAFRIHKSDLRLRPVWHQKQERVEAHVLVCFLAYVLWKTLAQWCKHAGLGDEPRKVLDELGRIQAVDVILPTRCGQEIRHRCVMRPDAHQSILLEKLKLKLPDRLAMPQM
jgi:transposase